MGNNSPIGQRQKALKIVRAMPANSVGAAIAKLLGQATGLVGNFCSGPIGDFYQRNTHLLRAIATDENILVFTREETRFFKSQPFSCARVVGSMLNAEERASLIRWTR